MKRDLERSGIARRGVTVDRPPQSGSCSIESGIPRIRVPSVSRSQGRTRPGPGELGKDAEWTRRAGRAKYSAGAAESAGVIWREGSIRPRFSRIRTKRRYPRCLAARWPWRSPSFSAQPPKQQPFLVSMTSVMDTKTERTVVDPNAIDPTGGTTIDFYRPSLDGRYVAVSLSRNGTEDGTVHLYQASSGKPLPDVLPFVN